jgi:hypothetical protein
MGGELAFNSKIDLWLLIVILTAVAACLWGIGAIWDADSVVFWPAAAILAVGIGLPVWILASLRYYLSDDTLRVRCGPSEWKIAIRDIRSVSATNEARTSPALSFDRLLIEYGDGGRVLISPEPRAEFLRQLEYRRKHAA